MIVINMVCVTQQSVYVTTFTCIDYLLKQFVLKTINNYYKKNLRNSTEIVVFSRFNSINNYLLIGL